jgi:Translin-associated factor X-interacting N-terminus
MKSNLKIVPKKINQKKNNSMSSGQKANTTLNQNPIQETNEKTIVFADSPYAKSLSKIRSHSQLKNKFVYSAVNSGVVSPLPGVISYTIIPPKKVVLKSTTGTKSTTNKEASGVKKKNHSIIRDIFERDDDSFQSISKLERKIIEAEKKKKENPISFEVFEVYRSIFNEIIELDNTFGTVLKKIKIVYEDWIKIKIGYVAENTQLKYDLVKVNKTAKDLKEQNEFLIEKIKKYSKENVKLGREIELKDHQYRSLQEHLIKISNISKDQYPPDDQSWKLIIAENNTYSELCLSMKKDIKNLKKNEKRLISLLDILRNKGFPVDEVYEENFKPNIKEKKSKPIESEDEECINTKSAKNIAKPACIPPLNLAGLHVPETLNDSFDYSSDYKSN